MKVIVVFKWSKNPLDALVGADGSVDWPGVKLSANDDDPAVMEIANALAGRDEIVALTVGDGDIAWAAARGAARTTVITDAQEVANGAVMGSVIAAAVSHLGDADVVLIGDSSWDYGVVAAVTGQLGRPAVAGVVAAEACGDKIKVTRKMGSVSQVLEAKAPVVLAVVATHAEQDAPGMKEVLMARKKPVEKLTVADLQLTPVAAAASEGTRFPDTPPAKIIDGADPVAACEQLLAGLRADGVL